MYSYFNRNKISSSGGENSKYSLLRKVFPSIQIGRDIDLEQYIQLRKSGKPVERWKVHYDRLTSKYTPEERKILIHVLRKFNHDFNRIFNQIIDRLYYRLHQNFRKKIDMIIEKIGNPDLTDLQSETEKKQLMKKLKAGLSVCSINHAKAYKDILLLDFFSTAFTYRQNEFTIASDLLKQYLNGSLFVEKQTYHFSMADERRRQTGETAPIRSETTAMRLYITKDDIKKMLVDEESKDEYDLAFAFYEKYYRHLRDINFANKLYIYSRTNNTNHFKIFDCMRRGYFNHFRKERIYDDIFKIICQGRYIYNIKKEKDIQRKIWLFNKLLQKEETMKKIVNRKEKLIESKIKDVEIVETNLKSVEPAIPPIKPILAIEDKSRIEIPTVEVKEDKKPIEQPSRKRAEERLTEESENTRLMVPEKPERTYRSENRKKSISEMIEEITSDPRQQKILVDEYKNRLTGYIMKYFKDLPGVDLEQEEDMKKFKSFLRYILQNYDRIILGEEEQKLYDREMKKFGFNINLFYTVIFECYMDLKSDYLLNSLPRTSGQGLLAKMTSLFRK